jgi:predicted PhzF superfamily epimerase YddE/YHI9
MKHQGLQLPSVEIFQVDSFTRLPLTGNPAGVVLSADSLTDQKMQSIA